jgi:hypothetical protein
VATFPIDRVVPKSAGGTNDPDNVALTCPHCNAHKWTDGYGLDPRSGNPARFFHPRRDVWADHFEWSAEHPGELVGKTATGRATVAGLRINDADMLELRLLLAEVGLFPHIRTRLQPSADQPPREPPNIFQLLFVRNRHDR